MNEFPEFSDEIIKNEALRDKFKENDQSNEDMDKENTQKSEQKVDKQKECHNKVRFNPE